MLATPKSKDNNPGGSDMFRSKFMPVNGLILGRTFFVGLLLLLMGVVSIFADTAPPPNPVFVKRAEKAFDTAKAKMNANTNDTEAAWMFARSCFDFADLAPNDAKREEIANQGIAVSRRLIETNPKSIEGHYYLSMNLGELAETKTLGALKIVNEMEKEFKLVLEMNPGFDHAGPNRNLGLLYRDAPGWPTSIGNRAKSRQHLQQAVILAPDFPENLMNLVEGEQKWGDNTGAIRDLKSLETLWPKAQKQYAGEDWEVSWADWQHRRDIVEKKAAEYKVLHSPRQP